MSDPRVTPDASVVRFQKPGQIKHAVVNLCRQPEGSRDRQLLLGDAVRHLGDEGGWAYVQSGKDGYCGYVPKQAVGPSYPLSHCVSVPATHAYVKPDFKSPDRISLSFGSRIAALSETDTFIETEHGFILKQHVLPILHRFDDPANVAALFLGTPYLWGGNSRWGIDCSGLIQAALLACGTPCPGDSDMQETLGFAAAGPYLRNDLLFWKGHVALVADAETLIHANAGAMATVYEPIKDAVARIAAQGDGPVTAHRRLSPLSGFINSPPEA